jgi:T-complex protein 1 subunit theta
MVSKMKSSNTKGPHGLDINTGTIVESSKLNVWDHLNSKVWALRLASDAALTILRID